MHVFAAKIRKAAMKWGILSVCCARLGEETTVFSVFFRPVALFGSLLYGLRLHIESCSALSLFHVC